MQTLVRPFPPVKTRPQVDYPQNLPHQQIQISKEQPVCPCCSETLLRHVRRSGIYWRCSHCHQEMPVLSAIRPLMYSR